jgi:hypothetical protein
MVKQGSGAKGSFGKEFFSSLILSQSFQGVVQA